MKQDEILNDVLDALRQVQFTLKELDERSKRAEERLSALESKHDSNEVVVAAVDGGGTTSGGAAALSQIVSGNANAMPTEVIAAPPAPPPEVKAVSEEVIPSQRVVSRAPPLAGSGSPPAPVSSGGSARAQGSIESRIGMYWLNRLGIVILVIGLGYLLSHAYDLIGPVGKLAVGFIAASALIVGGEILARRPKLGWYGQGLIGGGWALTYFAVYAMQNIAAVKVIDDPIIAAVGLLTVAAASMSHAMFRRSEAIGMLASILAFGTISLSPVTTFSVAATAITVAGLAVIVVRMRWYAVQLAAVAATYGTYVVFTNPRVTALDEYGGFWLSFGFLAMFWCVFGIVSLLLARAALQAAQAAQTALTGIKRFATLDVLGLNAAAFIVLTVTAMNGALSEYRWAFCLFAASAHGLFAIAAHRSRWSDGSTLASLIGLGLFTAFVPLKLDTHATVVVWLLQVPLLMFVGAKTNARSFRWFAYGLAGLTATSVWRSELSISTEVASGILPLAYGLIVGASAVAAYFAGSLSLRYAGATLSESERQLATPLFGGLAAGFLLLTTCWHCSHSMMAVCFAIEALALIALAMRWSSRSVHCIAAIFFAATAASLVAHFQHVSLPVSTAVTLMLYGVALAYRRGLSGVPENLRVDAFHVGFLVCTVAVYISTVFRADGVAAYLPLSLEMVPIVLSGFALRDRVVRLAGLAALLPVAAFVLLQHDGWSWIVVLPVVACASVLYGAYRYLSVGTEGGQGGTLSDQMTFSDDDESSFATRVLGGGASLLLTAVFWQLLSWRTLAGAWALEGLSLVAVGFVVRDKLLRLIGLGVFALMAAKLLFFDLSGADTMERIVSFIVAGVVLLVASFAYSRFEDVMQRDRKSSRND